MPVWKLIYLFMLYQIVKTEPKPANNVCSNLFDYAIIRFSENCWYNPDVGSTVGEIITRYGYPYELHTVTTEDGYKLGIFRIPNKGRPVFLQHGLGCTAQAFLSLANNSLAFQFYNFGFDVWLGNFRGTIYSNNHTHENLSEAKYWDFSFYELGFYDLPAMLDFVHSKNLQKIIYVGHSMGTTSAFVYSILHSLQAQEKILAFIALAPVAFMKNSKLPIGNLAPISKELQLIANFLNIYKIGMSDEKEKSERYENCLNSFYKKFHCEMINEIILALNLDSVAPEALPLYISQIPSGTSLKTIRHYSQEIVANGHFQFYDYENFNWKKYGSEKAPLFDVTKITIPVYLFYGKSDAIADEKDVYMLYEKLQTSKFIKKIAEDDEVAFKHLDFLFDKNINYLYKPLFKVVSNITSM